MVRRSRLPRGAACAVLAVVALGVGPACGVTDAAPPQRVPLAMQMVMPGHGLANAVAASYVDILITGLGVNPPVTGRFFFDTSGTATASVVVPVGFPRILEIKIYDIANVLLFQGIDTIAVLAGTNPPKVVNVTPVNGNVPIQIIVGSYVVSVSPTSATIALGATRTFTATVLNPGGAPSAIPARWATSNPAIVTVDSISGVATGVLAGSTTITATALGVAAAATVTVP